MQMESELKTSRCLPVWEMRRKMQRYRRCWARGRRVEETDRAAGLNTLVPHWLHPPGCRWGPTKTRADCI